jgi:hypothetical protein
MCTELRTARLMVGLFHDGTRTAVAVCAKAQTVRRTGAMKLQINEGPIDRLLRILLGAGLFAISAAGSVTAPLLYVVLALAGWVVLTGLTGFCPLYVLLRISTLPKSGRETAGGSRL